jgi:hypothetical protein
MKKAATKNAKGLITNTFDEKKATPKMQRGLSQRPPIKKATPKNAKGLIAKTFDEKEATKKCKGAYHKDL